MSILTPPVLAIFALAVSSMFVISSVEWTLLLYLNYISNTDVTQSSLYIFMSAIPMLIPVLANVPLAFLSAHFGSGKTLFAAHITIASGVCLMLLFPHTRSLLIIGFVLYATISSLRVIRMAVLADIVSRENRTAVLAYHLFMAPIGALLGPFIWLILQNKAFYEHRFTISYSISISIMTGAATLAFIFRNSFRQQHQLLSQTTEQSTEYGSATTQQSNPQSEASNDAITTERVWLTAWFIALMLPNRITMQMVNVTFQPALVATFGMDDAGVGRCYFIIALFSVVPPLLVARMSKRMKDGALMVLGLCVVLFAGSLYLPFGGRVHLWAIVTGYVLMIVASAFFNTAVISVFTKCIGSSGARVKLLGFLWSIVNGGPALVQIMLRDVIVREFGSWGYSIFLIPAAFSLVGAVSPFWWSRVRGHDNRQIKGAAGTTAQ